MITIIVSFDSFVIIIIAINNITIIIIMIVNDNILIIPASPPAVSLQVRWKLESEADCMLAE